MTELPSLTFLSWAGFYPQYIQNNTETTLIVLNKNNCSCGTFPRVPCRDREMKTRVLSTKSVSGSQQAESAHHHY